MSLEVPEVKVFTSNYDTGASVGYGMITFCEAFSIKFTIMKAPSSGSIFISWPQKKKANSEEWLQHITFASPEVRKKIDDVIIAEFNKKIGVSSGGKTKDDYVNVVVRKNTTPEATGQNEEPAKEAPAVTPKKRISWG
jgi:DNA-binding cell septation regulator SpoVG